LFSLVLIFLTLFSIEKCTRILSNHSETIHGLTWINESLLTTGCEAGQLIIHDIRTSHVVWSINLTDIRRSTDSGANTSNTLRSIACLSALATQPDSETAEGWNNFLLGVGCVGGYCALLSNEKIVFDKKIHGEDIRSLELFDYSYHPSTRSMSPYHQLHALTSSYDSSSALWRFHASDSDSTKGSSSVSECIVKFTAGHTDKNLSAVLTKESDVVTTGADGNVILWMKN
jgi:hypothetical protein